MSLPLASRSEFEEERLRESQGRRFDPLRYSRFSPGHLYMLQELERELLRALRHHGFDSFNGRRVLEVGCGTGQWLRQLVQWGARPEDIAGVELLPERAASARALCPQGVRIDCGSATELRFPDASFDVVIQITLFTSVLDAESRARIAGEMRRVLRPGGLVAWYDFRVNSPRNPDVRGITRRELRQLFPGWHVRARSLTLIPPLARTIAPRSPLLCELLAGVPFLCTHTLASITSPCGGR